MKYRTDFKERRKMRGSELNQMIEEKNKKAMSDLVLKGVLTQYLQENTLDDLLAIVSGLAAERDLNFTFYRAR
jgi:hypothetical protein